MKMKVVAIVPAAGLGKRFGTSIKKPFVNVAGIPLFIHTLKRLQEVKSITEIIPVLRKEDIDKGLKLVESYSLNKIEQIAPGGKERQDSVYNALRLIEVGLTQSREDYLILIHDGVRPLISAKLVARLLQEAKRAGSSRTQVDGVIPGLSVRETLKEIDTKGFILSTVQREKFWTIQTPQVFPYKVIKKAYDRAYTDGFFATDDASLVERIGGKVKIIMGDPLNIKVTTREDMEMVEFLHSKGV